MVVCPKCRMDIVVALVTDKYFDCAKAENGLWCVPLVDLIYLEDGRTESGGDRILWGQKTLMDQAIADYLKGRAEADGSLAGGAT